jgi:phosphoenolpyruvate-protein kinase (PTS system EI component)
MISAQEVRDEQDKKLKEKRELYLSKFDEIYQEMKDKLETSIKAVMEHHHRKTHVIIHDTEIADKLEKECQELGYKVKYSLKERQFHVEW